MKYAIGVEYSGSGYCGWQRQLHCDSIQQNLETAIGFVANHAIELVCAGRTDAGVHAIEQVAHFESGSERDERAWVLGSNCRLPRDIRIKWITPVDDDFHARFGARARSYRYIIQNSNVPGAIFQNRVCWEFRKLDHQLMHDCAQLLIGEHDFSSFRAAGCQAKTASRNVHSIEFTRQGEMIFMDITANAFLYHMVRNIIGSLIVVGTGEQDCDWFSQVFRACDRKRADITAAASGLYFVRAWFDDQYKLPMQAKKPVLF